MATVTISQLVCEQMYTITAGGIIMNLDYELIGPRFYGETISAPACPIPSTTSFTPIGKLTYIDCICTCIDEHALMCFNYNKLIFLYLKTRRCIYYTLETTSKSS